MFGRRKVAPEHITALKNMAEQALENLKEEGQTVKQFVSCEVCKCVVKIEDSAHREKSWWSNFSGKQSETLHFCPAHKPEWEKKIIENGGTIRYTRTFTCNEAGDPIGYTKKTTK